MEIRLIIMTELLFCMLFVFVAVNRILFITRESKNVAVNRIFGGILPASTKFIYLIIYFL